MTNFNFQEEVCLAQAELANWTEEEKNWMQLEGTDPYLEQTEQRRTF